MPVAKAVRLNTYTPLEAPWDTPVTEEDQTAMAESAVISGAATEADIQVMFNDTPRLFVSAQRLASR
jgi:hypothetical protein